MKTNNKAIRREKIRDFVDANSKSQITGAIYTLIYGPLGFLYSNPKLALLTLLVAIGLGIVYWPLIGVVWIACVILAPFQVRAYNAKIRRNARYIVN